MRILILFFIFQITTSCAIEINGYYSDYKEVKKRAPNLIQSFENETAICTIPYSDSCIVIKSNASHLKNCIKNKEKAIVYFWKPHCHGRHCYSIDALQRNCLEQGIDLYVFAEYYDISYLKKKYELVHPIIGIDTKYYKARMTFKYIPKFFYELTGLEHTEERWGRLVYLENGQYIGSYNQISRIPSEVK